MTAIASVALFGIACLAFGYIAAEVFEWILAALRSRGEVADAPTISKSPDEFPAKRTCRFNATPHWCADTSSDDDVIAAMERQFPKTRSRRIK